MKKLAFLVLFTVLVTLVVSAQDWGMIIWGSNNPSTENSSPSNSSQTQNSQPAKKIIGYTITVTAGNGRTQTYSIYTANRSSAEEEAKSKLRSYYHMKPDVSVRVTDTVPIYQ